MKPKNFPARRMARVYRAAGLKPTTEQLSAWRAIRTKKHGDRISRQSRRS